MNNDNLYNQIKNELKRLNELFLNDQSLAGIGLYTGLAGNCLFMSQKYILKLILRFK